MSIQLNQNLRILSHRCSFADLNNGDHIYTVNGHGAYTHHGIVVELGPDTATTQVIEFNVPRDGTLLPELTAGVLLRPDVVLQMIASARVQKVSLDSFLAIVGDEDGSKTPSPSIRNGRKPIRRVRYDTPTAASWFARAGANRSAVSDPPDVTVARAFEFLHSQQWPRYEVFLNNCEHFAVFCKTGLVLSAQADRIPETIRKDVQHRLDRIAHDWVWQPNNPDRASIQRMERSQKKIQKISTVKTYSPFIRKHLRRIK